jgi:bifunctional non-homologous end joining protein LigD
MASETLELLFMRVLTYPKNRTAKPIVEKRPKSESEAKHIFVVHRHDSSTLHYDLRLEIGGVLKCWAIPSGPSLNPNDKRLAILVEDHPVSYASFSGVVPAGSFESGVVAIWDKGTFSPVGAFPTADLDKLMQRQIKEGNLKFFLRGKILKGSFRLLRLKERNDNLWLLIKGNDGYAVDRVFDSEDYVDK